MVETLKSKIFSVNTVRCYGVVSSYNPRGLTNPVDALLTTRIDGTVEVACPFYREHPPSQDFQRDDHGTCSASDRGNSSCAYRKNKPDTKLD